MFSNSCIRVLATVGVSGALFSGCGNPSTNSVVKVPPSSVEAPSTRAKYDGALDGYLEGKQRLQVPRLKKLT